MSQSNLKYQGKHHHQVKTGARQLHVGIGHPVPLCTGGNSHLWPSAMPRTIPLHGPVGCPPCADQTIHQSFVLIFPCTECLRSTRWRRMALVVRILPNFNLVWVSGTDTAQKGAKGRAHRYHPWSWPSPEGLLCILLRICRWCSSKESPARGKTEQQQVILPVLLQADGIYTASARLNPQSLTRTDPMLLRSLWAEALIYILNSRLRRPNLLWSWGFFSCLFWLSFLAKVQPRFQSHHLAQMCRAPSSRFFSSTAIHGFLENITKKSCQSWTSIISN